MGTNALEQQSYTNRTNESVERSWFAVDVFIDGDKIATGEAMSERAARREAASTALSILEIKEGEIKK